MPLRGRLNRLELKTRDMAGVCVSCGLPHVDVLLARLWDSDAAMPEAVCDCKPCGCRDDLAQLRALDGDDPDDDGGEPVPVATRRGPKPTPRRKLAAAR